MSYNISSFAFSMRWYFTVIIILSNLIFDTLRLRVALDNGSDVIDLEGVSRLLRFGFCRCLSRCSVLTVFDWGSGWKAEDIVASSE